MEREGGPGLLGIGDRFLGPMLRGTFGSPDYRFLEIRLDGNWTNIEEAININVYASLFSTDPLQYLDKSNGSPRDTDPDMVQDGSFELGARKWGRLLFLQLTPGMRNNEEMFLDPFHFSYSERCTFGTSKYCNVKEGTFVTSEFPPPSHVSNKVRHRGRMASVYLRLKTAVTIHTNVRMNKTFLDMCATMGGTIGMIFFFFNFITRDVVNGAYHKVRWLKRMFRETAMMTREVQQQNRVHDLVDSLPVDEVLRYLLDQSYKHREALNNVERAEQLSALKLAALEESRKHSAAEEPHHASIVLPFTPIGSNQSFTSTITSIRESIREEDAESLSDDTLIA